MLGDLGRRGPRWTSSSSAASIPTATAAPSTAAPIGWVWIGGLRSCAAVARVVPGLAAGEAVSHDVCLRRLLIVSQKLYLAAIFGVVGGGIVYGAPHSPTPIDCRKGCSSLLQGLGIRLCRKHPLRQMPPVLSLVDDLLLGEGFPGKPPSFLDACALIG